MTPVSSSPGWTTRKPNTAGAPTGAGPDFTSQLQSLLQNTKPSPTDQADAAAPSRATIGHLHPGGMNDAVHRLLKLGGKG